MAYFAIVMASSVIQVFGQSCNFSIDCFFNQLILVVKPLTVGILTQSKDKSGKQRINNSGSWSKDKSLNKDKSQSIDTNGT